MGYNVIEFAEFLRVFSKFDEIRFNEPDITKASRTRQLSAMGNVLWHEVDADKFRVRVKRCHVNKAQTLSTTKIEVTEIP